MATRYSPSDENIRFLGKKILEGDLVAVPTETVYGLAANAFDAEACARIFEVKNRPSFDPLIVHLAKESDLSAICVPNALASVLAEKFWPGPLTLVLPKTPRIPDIVTSGLPSVAVRVPAHPAFQSLLRECGVPLAAPSANPFGYVSPTRPEHVEENLGERISHILDGGPCPVGIESTIVDLRDPEHPGIVRPGSIPAEIIENELDHRLEERTSPSESGVMPGQIDRHYSPRAPLRLFPFGGLPENRPARGTARIHFSKPNKFLSQEENVFWLSESGSPTEAAARLFDLLHRLDRLAFREIEMELAPPEGLGHAINDRLRRAGRPAEKR